MIDSIRFIGGKDLAAAKYAVELLGKNFYAGAFNFSNPNQTVKSTLKRFQKVFILHKAQDEEFRKNWPDIYTEKKIYLLDIPEGLETRQMRKQVRKKLLPYFREKMTEMMIEVFGKEKIESKIFPGI